MPITSATIPPPPRLTGNPQIDMQTALSWMWDLYRVVAVELEVPQAVAGIPTSTDGLTEGTTNLYLTNERVDDRVADILVEGSNIGISYNDTTGEITISNTASGLADTDELPEGSTNLYYTSERVDDRVAALIQNGTSLTWTYNDVSNTLTGNVSVTQYTDELAQDAVGGILTDTATIDFTYNDGANTITADVKNASIDLTTKVTGTLPVANGGTNATTTRAAAASLKVPYILAASAVASSHTGDTSETSLASVTIPGNSMGANGRIRVTSVWSWTNSANNKVPRMKFGGTTYLSSTLTTNASQQDQRTISNRNATNSQVGLSTTIGGFGSSSVSPVTSAVDTTSDVTLEFTGQLTNSGETITLESYLVELIVP